MTPQTKQVLQEAFEICERIHGKKKAKIMIKDLKLDFKKDNREVKHGSRSSKG
jgi:hypothetical protein